MDVRARVAVANHRPGDNLLQVVTDRPEAIAGQELRRLAGQVRTGIGFPVAVTVVKGGARIEELVWRRCPALAELAPEEVPHIVAGDGVDGSPSPDGPHQFDVRERAIELQHEYLRWRARRGLLPSAGFAVRAARFDREVMAGGFPALR